jgi:epoxyqueuosine reductase
VIKEALVERAHKLGFDLCRVARCEAPPHGREFRRWLSDGCAGDMAWLERNKERRTNPQLVLPGARSVIVVGLNYWQGQHPRPEGPGIARYAWGDDYHDLMLDRLRELSEFLREHGGEQKCYVDTGPVLERDYAALAGAGWHGKSTMLISRKLGTWFLLGEILSTLPMTPDPPEPDRCGRCTRCLDACPTGAISSPHHLDARRCISYLTIESKGSIPENLRPFLGDRIYGCDDCLTACPWNRFAQISRETAFHARQSTTGMSLRDYLELTEEEFRTLFRRSPIKRIKRRGFLRNVCVALGNVGTAEDLPALKKAVRDPEPLISEHARWAIARIQLRTV